MLDACGIEAEPSALFAPLPYQWCDNNNLARSKRLAGVPGAEIAAAIAGVSGRSTCGAKTCTAQVKHAADLGLKGLKLHPNAQ